MGKSRRFSRLLGMIGLGAILAGGLAVGLAGQAAADEIADKVKKNCAACHGQDGHSKYPKVPSIAGFSAETIRFMLEEYKSEDRTGDKFKPEGGEETTMNAITRDMSRKDILAYAKYFAAQKFVSNKGKYKFDEALAKKGAGLHSRKCEKCHSDGGTNAEDDASLLAGLSREYITRAFEKLENGEQPMPKKMKKKFRKLKDKHIRQLIEYYVAGGGEYIKPE